MAMFTLLLLRLYDLMYEVRPLVDWLSPQSCRLIVMSSIKKFLTVKHTNGLSLVDTSWGVVLKELKIMIIDSYILTVSHFNKRPCIALIRRKPDNHIGWATSMLFASIYPTNHEICTKKYWELAELKNSVFLGSAILNFASSPWKLVTNYMLEWVGLNFYYYDGLQPKMRAGIINEHECIL